MFCFQNCKAYAKKSIQYLPPIGWMWKFSEFVFLERSFDKDKEIIKRQISEICDYPDPVWVSKYCYNYVFLNYHCHSYSIVMDNKCLFSITQSL